MRRRHAFSDFDQQAAKDIDDAQSYYYPEEIINCKDKISSFSIRDLYNIHIKSSLPSQSINNSQYNKINEDAVYQLVLNIKHCIFKAGNDTKLYFSIYDNTDKQTISEQYTLHLSDNNFPKVGLPEDCKIVFCNISHRLLQHDIFIICRIHRIGPLIAPDVNQKKQTKKQKMKKIDRNSKHLFVRPFGVCVIRLKDHIPLLLYKLGQEIEFEPGSAPIVCSKDEHRFAELQHDIISQQSDKYLSVPLTIGIAHGLTLYDSEISNEHELKTSIYGFIRNELSSNLIFDNIVCIISEFMSNAVTNANLTQIKMLDLDARFDTMRHMLYAKILSYRINARGKTQSHLNACIKMQLRDNKTYKVIPGGVMIGAGPMAMPINETQSVIYHARSDPVINETYRVLIPSNIEKMKNLHLYFTCWHVKNNNGRLEERGFGYIKLYNENIHQFTKNDDYEIPIYVNDKQAQKGYLDNTKDLKQEQSINIELKLVSNKIYADMDIETCLTWNVSQNAQVFVNALKRASKQPFVILMNIFDAFMNSIFSAMLAIENENEIEVIFGVLCNIFTNASKRINALYLERIDSWIENEFGHAKVWQLLSSHFINLLRWTVHGHEETMSDDDALMMKAKHAMNARKLQNSTRAIKYLLKIIRRSFEIDLKSCQNGKDCEFLSYEYNMSIQQLLSLLSKMMSKTAPSYIAGPQSYTMRNFEYVLDAVYNATSNELAQIICKFITSCNNKGVHNSVEMLLLTTRFLDSDKIESDDVLSVLLPTIIDILHFDMDETQSLDQHAMSFKLIKKCIPFLKSDDNSEKMHFILDEFVIILCKLFVIFEEIRNTDLFEMGSVYLKNQKIFDSELASTDQSSIHCECFVIIAELAQIFTNTRIQNVILHDENANDLIESVLCGCNNVILSSTVSEKWLILRLNEAQIAYKFFVCFGDILYKLNATDQAWKEWLKLGMSFLLNASFAIENMKEKDAKFILDYCNGHDIRYEIVNKLKQIWSNIPSKTILTLSDIITSAAIQINSACKVEKIQSWIIDAYFQVIVAEFECSSHINSIKQTTIDQIDQLTSNQPDEANRFLDFFRIGIKNKLTSSNYKLREMCLQFIKEIESLNEHLIELNKIPNDKEHEDEFTFATMQLLDYFNSSKKDKLYGRYMHKLALMHQSLGNHVQSGLCYKFAAERLKWSHQILSAEPLLGLSSNAEWKRHEIILEFAYQQFVLGEYWEMAAKISRDLCMAYQHYIFDLAALQNTLKKEAQLWKFIGTQDRIFNACYFVTFRGEFNNEFGDNVAKKSFIYQSGNANKTEDVRDFTQRIKEKYKDAIVKNSSEPIPEQYDFDDYKGQFIQITTLSPSSKEEFNANSVQISLLISGYISEQESFSNFVISDPIKQIIHAFYPQNYGGGEWKWKNRNAPLRLKAYYRENELTVFYFTSVVKQKKKRKKNENEFRSLWIRKTFVVAQDSIPSISRRVAVSDTKTIIYTPFETAINNILERNDDLKKVYNRLENDDLTRSTNNLSMNLNGILDAAVMGGIAKYKEAFFDGQYLKEYPHEIKNVHRFTDALKEQCVIAKRGLDLYEKYASEALQPHVDHLRGCYKKLNFQVIDLCKDVKNLSIT